MSYMLKNFHIKIPNSFSVFFCDTLDVLIIKSDTNLKIVNLKNKLFLLNNKIVIKVFNTNKSVKKDFISQKLVKFLIQQSILELKTPKFCAKLMIKGVGYRFLPLNKVSINTIHLKAGFSHALFVNPPKGFHLDFFKTTKLYILGDFYQKVTQFASFVRSLKKPEPYKNKGIRYENENLVFKQGKKI